MAKLRRHRQAGAIAAAVFAFPPRAMVPDDFFETNLMTNSSEAVILEGDNPLLYVDLDVFIAPATRGG